MVEPTRKITLPPLDESALTPDPMTLFDQWFRHALGASLIEPTAMTLATASKDGIPSARIVLLKAYDSSGFSFFTNYESRKGRDLAQNPNAALVFYWPELERQIRIAGTVSKVSRDESQLYFATRPLGSRLGAWASMQSQVIGTREELQRRLEEARARFPGDDIPLPPFWGGYRLAPSSIEFWQAGPNRLHDRFRYTREAGRPWRVDRLSP